MAETDTTYTPPEMLSDIDDGAIHARMMDALPADIDVTEGGFAHDFTRPAAIEKADMMILLNEAVQMAYPKWSYGVWLDEHAAMAGLSRRQADAAAGVVQVAGERGTRIPAGFLFSTASDGASANLVFEAEEDVEIGADGAAAVPVRCAVGGVSGNVAAHAVALMVEPIAGITSVVNGQPMTGGADEESDDELRERIRERNRGIDASYAGSVADYARWAKEVPGVGDVKVIPEWAGAGTVKLILVDQDGLPAGDAVIERVIEHIVSPSDDQYRKSPIGAAVTVSPPEVLEISVSATVALRPDAWIEDVTEAFERAMNAYLAEAAHDGEVRLSRVGMILGGIDGVLDFSNHKLNGAPANVAVEPDEYPALFEVTLNEG